MNALKSATVFEQFETVHNNPVRRGLCAKPEDWPWSGAAGDAGLSAGPLRRDRESRVVFVV